MNKTKAKKKNQKIKKKKKKKRNQKKKEKRKSETRKLVFIFGNLGIALLRHASNARVMFPCVV